MKQILTYISPKQEFNEEHKMAVKIQIDNSLALGWKPEDIILITNFPYIYKDVCAIIIGDSNYCEFHWPATKIYVIEFLFRAELIGEGTYWYHDFDCFQLEPFPEDVLGDADWGITNYGRMPRLCSASIFFKRNAAELFFYLKKYIVEHRIEEERALGKIIELNPEKFKHLNITYAFHKFNLRSCYKIADKPIKAAHFHLTPDKYDFYVRGNNKLQQVLIPNHLIEIFHQHGFTG